MKAIVQDRYGATGVLRLREIDPPTPGAGEVLVAVRAAGVDPGVWHLMTGRPYLVRAMGFGLRRPRATVRGRDLAGVVERAGPAVTGFQPGDEVYGTCDTGSFAEYATVPAHRLAGKPAGISFEQAAATPVSGVTALQAVRDRGRVRAGQRVMVIGAAGGVGSFAVQLAKAFGATVTAVCGTGKADLARALGADEVIDYTREPLDRDGPRHDLIVDTAGNRPLGLLRRAMTPHGTLVLVGGEHGGGALLGGFDRQLRAPLTSTFVSQRLCALIARENADDLRTLAQLIDAGSVTPRLDRTYPLAQAAEAIDYLAEGHAAGKVALTI
jgi:NADPH:quinone reductase-like Zn-dependent oxidoreductase